MADPSALPATDTDAMVNSLLQKLGQSSDRLSAQIIPFRKREQDVEQKIADIQPPPEPTLTPVPTQAPPPQITQSLSAMSSPLMFLAALSGAFGGPSAIASAVQNATGFLNGIKKGDADTTKENLDQFNTNVDAAMKSNQAAIDKYRAAFEAKTFDLNKLNGELRSIASEYGDPITMHAIETGDLESAFKLVDLRQRQQEALRNHQDMMNLRIDSAWKDATLHLKDGSYVSGQKNAITNSYRDASGNDIPAGRVDDTLTGIPAEAIVKPDAAKEAAELALKGDWKDALNGVGFGNAANLNRAIIRDAIQKQAAAKGMTGGDIANVIGQFDALVAGYRSAGQLSGRLTVFASEAQQAGDFLKEVNDQFPDDLRTQYKDINSLVQAFQTRTGGTQVIALGGALNSFANSYMRVASGGGTPRLAYYDHAMDILNKAYSEGQLNTGIETLQAEIERALQAPGTAMSEFQKVLQGTAGTGESAASQAGRVLTGRPAPSTNDPYGLR